MMLTSRPYLCALMVLQFCLLACSGHARADMGSTFYIKGLSERYALPCERQANLRRLSLAPPHFPGRPQEFANDAHALVVYSPFLTTEQRATAESLMASVPSHVLPIAYMGGAVYVFARRSIVEAVPALAVEASWFGDFGLYMAVERRLYFPFESGEGLTRQFDGTFRARRYVPSQREPFRIINHETGHMIDSLLGEFSLNSVGEDGDSRLSNRRDFMKALRTDYKRLSSPQSPLRPEEMARLGYYLPREFEGIKLGGMHPEQRARREIFAELWAEVQGYDSNHISRAYPDTFRVVQELNRFLEALYSEISVPCKNYVLYLSQKNHEEQSLE